MISVAEADTLLLGFLSILHWELGASCKHYIPFATIEEF